MANSNRGGDRPGAGIPLGLMAFWANIEPGYLERFRAWHNMEHMCERVAIPGFVAGRRYVAMSGGGMSGEGMSGGGMSNSPYFFMMYETEQPEVLCSEAYVAALDNPTPWTQESLRNFRDPVRNVYSLITDHGSSDFATAPCMITVRFNAGERDPRDEDWPALSRAWGAARLRHYEIDLQVAGIETSERKIHGASPGAQRHLLLIETDLPSALSSGGVEARLKEAMSGYADTLIDRYGIDYRLKSSPD